MSENKADPLRESVEALFEGGFIDAGWKRMGINPYDAQWALELEHRLKPIRAALAARQPAAPLGGRREAIARIIHPVGFDEDSMERISVVAAHRKEALAKADAILAIPQERGVERSAIIAECLEAAQIGFEESVSQYVLIGPGGIAMAIINAIRAIAGKDTER